MSKYPRRTPRSLIERAQDIFRVINSIDGPFAKTRLTEANISPKAAENWLDLIAYIQSQPRIKLTKTGHNTIVERIEGKHSLMSLKTFFNEDAPVDIRLQSLMDYSKEVLYRELKFSSNTPPPASQLTPPPVPRTQATTRPASLKILKKQDITPQKSSSTSINQDHQNKEKDKKEE